MRKHYDVMTSFPGCLPETNDVYERKEDALKDAADIARDYRADGNKVYGTRDLGYRVIFDGSTGSGMRIEFCECSDTECLAQADF